MTGAFFVPAGELRRLADLVAYLDSLQEWGLSGSLHRQGARHAENLRKLLGETNRATSLSTREVATILGCTAAWVRKLIVRGDLLSAQFSGGTRHRISRGSIDAYIARRSDRSFQR